jgi:hypothetical protein
MPDDLRIERIAYAGLAEIEAAPSDAAKAAVFAGIIVDMFNDYYIRSRRIPWLAKEAFETRNWPRALKLSHERIAIFGASIALGFERQRPKAARCAAPPSLPLSGAYTKDR